MQLTLREATRGLAGRVGIAVDKPELTGVFFLPCILHRRVPFCGGVYCGAATLLQEIRIMVNMRVETDSLGKVEVPSDKLWGAQTQRSLEHFSIGKDLIPREMITAYAILKKAAAIANHAEKRLEQRAHDLIVQVCDEILAGRHHDMFPLHVWMTGSGTQFNMNVKKKRGDRESLLPARRIRIPGSPLIVYALNHRREP